MFVKLSKPDARAYRSYVKNTKNQSFLGKECTYQGKDCIVVDTYASADEPSHVRVVLATKDYKEILPFSVKTSDCQFNN